MCADIRWVLEYLSMQCASPLYYMACTKRVKKLVHKRSHIMRTEVRHIA